MPEKHLISGPINVARLSGNIFGIDKVLYVYFDVHQLCQNESRCDDIFADDIVKHFIKEFEKINKKDMVCDFFLETFPISITYKHSWHSIYIQELRQLVAQTFSYNPKSNKVIPSKFFPHVRLHYIDIRQHFFWDILWTQAYSVRDILFQLQDSPSEDTIKYFVDEINKLIENLKLILDMFSNKKISREKKMSRIQIIRTDDERMDDTEIMNNAKYLVDKILNKYKHDEVKKNIYIMLDDYLKKGLLSAIDKLNIVIKLLDKFRNVISIDYNALNISTIESYDTPDFVKIPTYGINLIEMRHQLLNIKQSMDEIYSICIHVSSIIVDSYFLRRFLDKDYITNGISYTGSAHSMVYLYILVKYFDFKITHTSYGKYDIATLNKKIKENELGPEIYSCFMAPNLQQCSDITNFPIEFT